jgi:membrane protease YdiL (CAAX protease family)
MADPAYFIDILGQVMLLCEFGIWYHFRYKLRGLPLGETGETLYRIINDLRVRLVPVWWTVILPVASVGTWWLIWRDVIYYFLPDPTPISPLLTTVISAVVLAPVLESVMLGVIVNLFIPESPDRPTDDPGVIVLVLLCISLIFAVYHQKSMLIGFVSVTVGFMIYGMLYYYSGRNLVPAIIAHAVWNALVITM